MIIFRWKELEHSYDRRKGVQALMPVLLRSMVFNGPVMKGKVQKSCKKFMNTIHGNSVGMLKIRLNTTFWKSFI